MSDAAGASTNPADLREPCGLSVADLLALVAGLSFALAMMPAEMRSFFELDVWDGSRLPDPTSKYLLAHWFGSWIIAGLGVALLPVIAWRLGRYRRMPLAGEWLAIAFVVAAPPLQVEAILGGAAVSVAEQAGVALSDDDRLDDRHPHRYPAEGLMAFGAGVCLIGLIGWRWLNKPWAQAAAVLAVLLAWQSFPAWWGFEAIGGWEVRYVPLWNSVSWREFETLTIDVVRSPLNWLPVGIALACLPPQRLARRGATPWTDSSGPVLLLAAMLLDVLVDRYGGISLPGTRWTRLLLGICCLAGGIIAGYRLLAGRRAANPSAA